MEIYLLPPHCLLSVGPLAMATSKSGGSHQTAVSMRGDFAKQGFACDHFELTNRD